MGIFSFFNPPAGDHSSQEVLPASSTEMTDNLTDSVEENELKVPSERSEAPPVGAEVRISTPHAPSRLPSVSFPLRLGLIIKTRCSFNTLCVCVCVRVIMTHTGMYLRTSALTQTCVYALQMWGLKRV